LRGRLEAVDTGGLDLLQLIGVDVAREVGRVVRAGVDGVGRDAVVGPAAGRLDREEHDGRLGLAVRQGVVRAVREVDVLEDDGRAQVAARADRDDACCRGRGERAVQADGEREVPQVVGRELQLPAFGSQAEVGHGHHGGVVDEHVERPIPARDERGHRLWIGEIELRLANIVVAGRIDDVGRDVLAGLGVANGNRDRGARAREGPGRLDADARRAARHDRPLAGQVDAGDHLGGGRLEAERRRDERGDAQPCACSTTWSRIDGASSAAT
jgi:hypothetical protein